MALVRLIRDGTRLAVDAPPEVFNQLLDRLTFTEKTFLRGYEQVQARRSGLPLVEEVHVEAYAVAKDGKIHTRSGFTDRLVNWLRKVGHRAEVEYLWKPDPAKWVVNYERIKENYPTLDEDQWGLLKAIFEDPNGAGGRAQCPTGWGKGTIIGAIAAGLDRLNIHVIIKGISVMRQRLLPELESNMFDVGVIGGGANKKPEARLLLVSADSLHYIEKLKRKADLVLIDEGQKLSGDSFTEKTGAYYRAVIWALSATFDKRIDGKNYRQEMVAGPVRYSISAERAEAMGRTVPIVVLWVRIRSDVDPMAAYENDTAQKRHGIWRNEFRNEALAKAIREVEDNNQTLIACDSLEHALYFRKAINDLEPDKPYDLVYAAEADDRMDPRDRLFYVRHGMLGEDEYMTNELKQQRTDDFTAGKLRRVIATTVFNYGVSFNHLSLASRIAGGASVDAAQQFRGRLTRRADGKEYAILVDAWDVWNKSVKSAARARWRAYKELGSRQIIWDAYKEDFVEFIPS